MNVLLRAAFVLMLAGCAGPADHFYTLSPATSGSSRLQPPGTASICISLAVALPALLDRPQMVINRSANEVAILEHERWAAPLADSIERVLAADLEASSNLRIISNGSCGPDAAKAMVLSVDTLSIAPGDQVQLAVHWAIHAEAGATDRFGQLTLAQPINGPMSYQAAAASVSAAIAALAPQLAAALQSAPAS